MGDDLTYGKVELSNMHLGVLKSCQHDRYSVIAIMLRYIFALLHDALTLSEKSYRFL